MKLLIKNIKQLVGCFDEAPLRIAGRQMANFPLLNDAWLAIEDGLIADFGVMEEWPGISDWRDLEVIDATGKFVMPGFVDSHTHLVHASTREGEYVDRINGLSYADIAARGGGILNSAQKLMDASEDQLFEEALQRVSKAIKHGTTAFEIKSGYGLSLESEMKMLRVIQRLKSAVDVPVKATFLGAHAVPRDFIGRKDAYVDYIINEMLPAITAENLADYIDAFCEKSYFSVDDTLRIMEAGTKYGLKAKIHVNQFTSLGGVRAFIEAGALSLDHLEELSDDDLSALTSGSSIPVALPGCSHFLSIPYTPGRKLIDAGLPLALATDYNPGSAPSWNMNTVISLACTKMNLLPEEAICAATVNGAAALELENSCGAIVPGFKANLIITKDMPSLAFLPYSFGENLIDHVLVNGKKV